MVKPKPREDMTNLQRCAVNAIDLHDPEDSSFLIGTGSVIQCRAGRRVYGAPMHPRVTD
jgi:hypothetical protein